ncbi:MAG: dihydroneopterin aldolase [Nitrospira sp.]|nr:dihydroneopterin aldolase [Nitrospira sp.]
MYHHALSSRRCMLSVSLRRPTRRRAGGVFIGFMDHLSFPCLTVRKSIHDNAAMAARIVIERLEFYGHCGVTEEERRKAQLIAVDLELDATIESAAFSDRLDETIDYARVAERLVALGTSLDCNLLETLAEQLVGVMFAEFPVERVRMWIRKLHAPLAMVAGSVGVRFERTRATHHTYNTDPSPAPFLIQQLTRLPKGRVLDVAAGRGRHALHLLSHGMQVEALDRDTEALAMLEAAAQARHLPGLATRVLDLEQNPDRPPSLGEECYDAIVVFFYLHRPLFPALMEALKPNGMLLYETFTIDNYFRQQHPRRWEFCLAHNELLRLTTPLRVLHYDEGEHDGGHGSGPSYTARLVAQKAGPETPP